MRLPPVRADRGCMFCLGSEESATIPWRGCLRSERSTLKYADRAGAYVCSGCVEHAASVLAGVPAELVALVIAAQRRGVTHSWRPWSGRVKQRFSAADRRERDLRWGKRAEQGGDG